MNVRDFLKRIPSAVYLYMLLAIGIFGAYQSFVYHQRQIGKRELQIVQYEIANRDLRREADSLAKRYRVDTIWRRVTQTRVDTMATTVDRWKHDTLRVVEFVARADTAAKACTQALQTCEQRVGVATRGWDNARAENAILKASFPSKAKPWLYGAAGIGIGVLAGRWVK